MKWISIICLCLSAAGCVTVVNEERAKSMNRLELCSSVCELSGLTDTPLSGELACVDPNHFVVKELMIRFPQTMFTAAEFERLSQLPWYEANDFLRKGVSECAFLSLMRLPRGGAGSFYTSDDPGVLAKNYPNAMYVPPGTMTSYFYAGEEGTIGYGFTTQNPTTEPRVLTIIQAVDKPSYPTSAAPHSRSRKKESDVYLDGIRIPRIECIGAVVMGECKGTAVMPDRPGRKKCYGSLVGGKCIGAEF